MQSQNTAPLSALSIDPANVRKTGRGAEDDFVASIKAKGIIEPLVVRRNGKGFYVTNGGKRLASLEKMRATEDAANGVTVTGDYPVPIVIREEDEASARETSLIANIVRVDMHPVDEVEAFAQLVKEGKKPAEIATTYGIDTRRVEQRLALGGKLSPKIRQAWREDKIGDADAQAFTLAPDAKSQEALFERLMKRENGFDPDDVVRELKIKSDIGKMLNFVGVADYEGRKGKVTLDLFGNNHRVSDEKLLKAMVGEKLDAIAEKLMKQDGWAWAKVVHDLNGNWDYGRIADRPHPTSAERERLRELEAIDTSEMPEEEADKIENEMVTLNDAIVARSFKPEQRAKSGCFVCFEYHGLKIDYGRTKPEEKRKVEAQERADTRKKKAKTAVKKGESAGVISNALMERMSEALTLAAAKTLAQDPKLALAAIIAGFGDHGGKPVCVQHDGLKAKKLPFGYSRTSAFAANFAQVAKLGQPAQLAKLAEIAGAAIDMQTFNTNAPPLKSTSHAALCDALDPKTMNKALRESFDYKDYFESVSKTLVLKAITEAVNADEARKVAGKPKGDIAKFANANVPKTGWLPIELRTANYDGPGGKAKAKKKR